MRTAADLIMKPITRELDRLRLFARPPPFTVHCTTACKRFSSKRLFSGARQAFFPPELDLSNVDGRGPKSSQALTKAMAARFIGCDSRGFGAIMYARLFFAGSLLACGFLIGVGSALAQPQEVRVPLIMSMPRSSLPLRHSLGRRSYDAIKKHAGRISSQVLPLTRTEMWVVPQANVNALRKAAAQYGVVAKKLDKNWNHVFRWTPIRVSMNGMPMMALAKSSKATMGVGITQHAPAEVLEYALTKDAGAQVTAKDAPKIKLQLNEKTALTITRTSVDIKSDMCAWHGMVDGTNAPATIMWWPGVAMAGTVQHEGRIFSIKHMPGGTHTAVAVVEKSENRMPPDHAPMSARLRADDPNLRDDPLVRQGDASKIRSLIESIGTPATERSQAQNQALRQPNVAQGDTRGSTTTMGEAAGPSDITINVIVAYTKKVASNYADVRRELIELAIEEANQSFRNSNLGFVKLKLVHAYQTDYVEEGEHFNHLWRFVDKGDGYMDEIHGLRDKYDADVAVLMVDDPKGCGLSTRVFADAGEAFAVMYHECAALTYSLAHEIGHLIGARHELAVDTTMAPFPYGHGYVNGSKWRDIMSYKESCGGCPRLPIWSSPNLMIRGQPAGTENEDNARVIGEQAARVANFRASRNDGLFSAGVVPRAPDAATGDRALPK
jgi:hypothetical protein